MIKSNLIPAGWVTTHKLENNNANFSILLILNPISGFPAWASGMGMGISRNLAMRPAGFDYMPVKRPEETETPVLQGTNKILHSARSRKEELLHRKLNQNYLLSATNR